MYVPIFTFPFLLSRFRDTFRVKGALPQPIGQSTVENFLRPTLLLHRAFQVFSEENHRLRVRDENYALAKYLTWVSDDSE